MQGIPTPAPDAPCDDFRASPRLSGPDPAPARLLGRAGLRDPAALRHGGRRRHLPPRHHAAGAGAEALGRRLRPALAPPDRRALRREPQPPAALLPVPGADQTLARPTSRISTSAASKAIGIDADLHDIRFVEDDWESPTLGAWGLGWEVWCDGMEVSQFTYFQQVGGHDCRPVSGELDLWPRAPRDVRARCRSRDGHAVQRPRTPPIPLTYGDIFRQTEAEYSPLELRRRRHRDAVGSISTTPKPSARASSTPRTARQGRPRHRHGASRLRPVHQGAAISSTCSTPAA